MKTFNAGAMRRAIGGLHLGGANALVERTLAQHGLTQPQGFQAPFPPAGAQTETLPIPEGASFKADRFACAAGGRDCMVYVPSSATKGLQGLILMLHGCTQTHADFARGTGMNRLAERHRLVIVYPQQSRGENAQSCWNWFSPGDQRRGRGEPEILAQMAAATARAHDVPKGRVFVAGLSAGAAMAVILGQTHPDIFAAIGAHSGLPFGAAKDVQGAFAAMNGPGAPRPAQRRDAVPTPAIVFHGSADRTVHPLNSERIVEDTLAAGPDQTLVDQVKARTGGRRHTRTISARSDGPVLTEHWMIEGLGHAWSGGQPGGSYVDPVGPDASAEMVRFFLDQP